MDNIKNPIQPQDGLTDFDFEPVPDRSAIVDHIRPSMRYWPEVGKRLLKNKVAMFAVFLLLAIILMAIFGPILSPYEYDKTSLMSAKKPPSWQHLFGTDKVGRDIFTRVCMGTRTSLTIGVIGALIPYLLGMTIGAISGWQTNATILAQAILQEGFKNVAAVASFVSGVEFNVDAGDTMMKKLKLKRDVEAIPITNKLVIKAAGMAMKKQGRAE